MSRPDRPLELRLWLGWRRPDLAGGHTEFVQRLAHEFLPMTWDVMPLHGLRAYLPSILTASDGVMPDEVALLGYADRVDYESRDDDPKAKTYGEMHGKLFASGMPRSRSTWAEPLKPLGTALHASSPAAELRAAAGLPSWHHADAIPHMMLLRHASGSTPTPALWLHALASRWGDAAIWPTKKFSVLWFCARQRLSLTEVKDQLSASGAPALDIAAFHDASPVRFPEHAHGVPAQEGRSWSWRIAARPAPDADTTPHVATEAASPPVASPTAAPWTPQVASANVSLRQQLRLALGDWRSSVPAAWRDALQDSAPDFAAVPPDLTAPHGATVIPALRGQARADAPAHGHLWRALELVDPAHVRVVLLGQDPYPNPRRATGVAFEQGDLTSWGGVVASSLQRLMQALVRHRWPARAADPGKKDWGRIQPVLIEEERAGTLVAPPDLFTSWAGHGVLSLNSAFTWTSASDTALQAHMALWSPVLKAILRHLAARGPSSPLVVMSFGVHARAALQAAALPTANARVLHYQHPQSPTVTAADHVLAAVDPWSRINTEMARIGLPTIPW